MDCEVRDYAAFFPLFEQREEKLAFFCSGLKQEDFEKDVCVNKVHGQALFLPRVFVIRVEELPSLL